MNQYTKLFIENQEIDLFDSEDLPLNITKRVNNFNGDVQGDYSRASVRVPSTKNNIAILGSTRQFYAFRIEVDGQPSFNGLARVRQGKTITQGYGAIKCDYEINLISQNSNWFVLLGDTLLSDLTTEVVNFNTANIAAGFISDPSVRDFAFCLIKWKEWANNALAGTFKAPSYYEATPALYIKPLIIEAFNSIGYTVQSDFFDTDMFSKLILPTPVDTKLPKAYNDEYLNTVASISAPITFPIPNTLGNFPFNQIDVAAPQNPTAYDVVLYEYTAPMAGYYEVSFRMNFGATPPPAPYLFFVNLEVNGVAVLTPLGERIGWAFSHVSPGPLYPAAGTTLTATGIVFLNAGDIVDIGLSTSGGITVNSAVLTITGEAILEPGIDIDFRFFLKNWKFLDLLKGLTCMFNLTFETNDNARAVRIEPKDDYVATDRVAATSELKEGFYSRQIKDYSKIIDYKKEGGFEFPAVAGRFDYKYNSDSDETIEWIEKNSQFLVYESRFPMSSGADNSKQEEKEVPFFVKTIHVQDVDAKHPDSAIVPQFPLIYPQNYILDPTATEADFDKSPRIFYHAGQRFGALSDQDGYIEIYEVPGAKSELPLTFMVNYNDDSGLDPNLSFCTENIVGITVAGLMQRFYLQDLKRLDIGEIRKNYVQFNSVDELNFSFRTKGFIDGLRYIVQTIEGFNPLIDAPTNFKFLLDAYPDPSDISNIQDSPLLGVVSLLTS